MIDAGAALPHFYDAVRNVLECLGALSIVVGSILTLVTLVPQLVAREHVGVTDARYQLSRYLALALEFQLASDVLGTAIAPSWTALGQLAAIAAIRTALNYFLTREINEERSRLAAAVPPARAAAHQSTGVIRPAG
jgi:uncharacterized membrane protein